MMKYLKLEKNDSHYQLTLNRPEVRNAFDDSMISEMSDFFASLQKDSQVRVLTIKGSGESFCAGGDLNWMKSMVNFTEEENKKDSEKLFQMYQALSHVPVPVISVVHGHVMGGGLGLVAASDICLAEEKTQFCFSEVRLGLAPAVISAFVKPKILPRDLQRYFLTAEIFSSQQALEMGLVNEYGSEDQMNKTFQHLVKKISNNGPQAVRATKELIRSLNQGCDPMKQTTELIARLRVSEEGQEGLKAFFEKRKPQWLESAK